MREAPSSRSGGGSGTSRPAGSGQAPAPRARRDARKGDPAAPPAEPAERPAPRREPARPRQARRPTTLRDAMAPAVRRPTVTDAAPGARAPRAATARLPRPGVRRSVLRPVPDNPGEPLPKLPLLERPLASYYLLGSSAGLLLLLGLVMVLSASEVRSFADFGSSYTVFVRQATWMGIGLPVLLGASRMPGRLFRRAAYPAMGVTLLLLVAVLSPLGVESHGAQRWLGVGSLSIQPSELAKLALVLWSADLLTRKRRLLGDWKHLVIPMVPMTALLGGLIMMQPDMGTTIVVFSVLFVVLWVVGTPGRVYAALVGAVGALGGLLAVTEPYRLERLLSYRDPFADAQDTGWQAVHGIYALSSGGWWGEGLGASREKWPGLLPASYTDFILSIIGEELGLLGCLIVVGLFGVLGYAGLRVAHRADNHFVRLAAAGSTGWILTQAVVNMGAVVGLLPITGIPLPLVSFGGSSLVPTMFSIGMLLAFARSEPAAARLLAERAEARRVARAARRAARGEGEPRRPGLRRGRPRREAAPEGAAAVETAAAAPRRRAAAPAARAQQATRGRAKAPSAARAEPRGRADDERAPRRRPPRPAPDEDTGAQPAPSRARRRPAADEPAPAGRPARPRAPRPARGERRAPDPAQARTGSGAAARRRPEPGPYRRATAADPDGPPTAG